MSEARRGRPPGPTDIQKLLRSELAQWVKTNARCREQIDTILGRFSKDLSEGSLTREGHLEILEGLKNILVAGMRTVESGLRSLQNEAPQVQEDPEEIAAELIK